MATSLNKYDIALLKWLSKQKDGVYQNEVPRATGINVKAVSKSLYKLEKIGLVTRTPTVHNKRKTYIVSLNREAALKALEEIGESLLDPAELFNQVSKIPCISCQYINRCYEGGFYDPLYCPLLFEYFFSENMKDLSSRAEAVAGK
jgi:DNA-binding MarR family transcriptional regulator